MSNKTILVMGTGTIGEPLIGLLARHKSDLGFSDVLFHKRTPTPEDTPKIRRLIEGGAKLVTEASAMADFDKLMGLKSEITAEQALERADVVMDCTPAGNDNKEKIYKKYDNGKRGFTAQGSEKGFGKRFALGVNDRALVSGEDRFVQIVSCNTHSITTLLHAIAFNNGADYENLETGSFVCIRRSIDVTQDAKFIPSPKVDKHGDELYGTHHAEDATGLYDTLKIRPDIFSSAMQVNTQFMHTIHFNLRMKKPTSKAAVMAQVMANPHLAVTGKKSANMVFSFGRDYGPWGRLLVHSVIATTSLAVIRGGRNVVGFSFTPQDGNPLMSSMAAAAWFIDPSGYKKRIQPLIDKYLWKEI
jgi:glyceraldehyde-3-phosphate dehydrogenase (NAD(P))